MDLRCFRSVTIHCGIVKASSEWGWCGKEGGLSKSFLEVVKISDR
jgi:hypothetical protein